MPFQDPVNNKSSSIYSLVIEQLKQFSTLITQTAEDKDSCLEIENDEGKNNNNSNN